MTVVRSWRQNPLLVCTTESTTSPTPQPPDRLQAFCYLAAVCCGLDPAPFGKGRRALVYLSDFATDGLLRVANLDQRTLEFYEHPHHSQS